MPVIIWEAVTYRSSEEKVRWNAREDNKMVNDWVGRWGIKFYNLQNHPHWMGRRSIALRFLSLTDCYAGSLLPNYSGGSVKWNSAELSVHRIGMTWAGIWNKTLSIPSVSKQVLNWSLEQGLEAETWHTENDTGQFMRHSVVGLGILKHFHNSLTWVWI